jgi:hypothetical protein
MPRLAAISAEKAELAAGIVPARLTEQHVSEQYATIYSNIVFKGEYKTHPELAYPIWS